MSDMSQHVTSDAWLQGMQERVPSLLAKNGVFIVTFWNQVRPQESYYEAFRLFSFYSRALDRMAHMKSMPLRDKFIAASCDPMRHPDNASARSLSRETVADIAKQILAI